MKVGLKDINGKELQDGQHISIYNKLEHKKTTEGILKYIPGAFMIYPSDGSHQLLLYWYIREDKFEGEQYTEREKYEIEILG